MNRRRAAERSGRRAERACVWTLRLKGWHIAAERFQAGVGEIDIVARRGRTLAFIEVKARRIMSEALEAVTPRQRHRIERAAELFLSEHPKWRNLTLRFDVMVVRPGHLPRHIKDAWRPGWH